MNKTLAQLSKKGPLKIMQSRRWAHAKKSKKKKREHGK